MMTEEEDIVIEDVGMPRSIRRAEKLPSSLNKTLADMVIGKSFFLKTNNAEHTNRKIGAIRQRIFRQTKDSPEKIFSVHRETKNGVGGIRIYRLEDDKDYEQT